MIDTSICKKCPQFHKTWSGVNAKYKGVPVVLFNCGMDNTCMKIGIPFTSVTWRVRMCLPSGCLMRLEQEVILHGHGEMRTRESSLDKSAVNQDGNLPMGYHHYMSVARPVDKDYKSVLRAIERALK